MGVQRPFPMGDRGARSTQIVSHNQQARTLGLPVLVFIRCPVRMSVLSIEPIAVRERVWSEKGVA